ncbi:pigment epithelium-derived factor-like [Thalassophryne amazonica]|uniref:pigment epithelium-derived factor-like n=1 Tax=Thalassophryne amazonica TaxID=390379 RepID=UPI001471D73C|nr:pigment epithelium-derived factor-like [Thalassophryne amazonica]
MKARTFLLLFGTVLSCCQAQLETAVEEAGEEEEHVELFTTPATKMGAATSDFGYNLYRAMASRDPNANIFLAPISVSAVLTQLSMGASERAERQMFRALRYHTLQDPQLHNTLRDLLTAVQMAAKASALQRASICHEIPSLGLRVKQDFTLVEQQYNVRPKALNARAQP